MLIEFPFLSLVWTLCSSFPVSHVGLYFLINVSFFPQNIQALTTLVVLAQKTQERLEDMKYGEEM